MEQYANNPIEADHGRLKARLRPMRGQKRHRSARILAAGHALVQNVRRGHYDIATHVPARHKLCGRRKTSVTWVDSRGNASARALRRVVGAPVCTWRPDGGPADPRCACTSPGSVPGSTLRAYSPDHGTRPDALGT